MRGGGDRTNRQAGQAVSVLIELEAGFCFLPDALSSRDPLSTLRKNAMAAMRGHAGTAIMHPSMIGIGSSAADDAGEASIYAN
jgi:hypothetical protein